MIKTATSRRCTLLGFALTCFLFLAYLEPAHALPAGFQEYYVMGDESHVLEMLKEIQAGGSKFSTSKWQIHRMP